MEALTRQTSRNGAIRRSSSRGGSILKTSLLVIRLRHSIRVSPASLTGQCLRTARANSSTRIESLTTLVILQRDKTLVVVISVSSDLQHRNIMPDQETQLSESELTEKSKAAIRGYLLKLFT